MDVVTDLLDDDLDVARRRTVIAHVSALDPPLQPVLERQVAAVLAGRHSPDDGAAVVPALRLPPRYLVDPLVTREVDRQTTLMLLIKAARLHGVGNFKICRTSMGDDPTAAPDTRILLQQIARYRFLLSPSLLDVITEHRTSDIEQFDPRAVSVRWLCTAALPPSGDAQVDDRYPVGIDSSSLDGSNDVDTIGRTTDRLRPRKRWLSWLRGT